uniref:NAC-A/B domain-containing protein n=1 Tax=Pseudo-nitzschia australis TaxID=44445 RepID=A0A7S4ASC5_9STRA|mmetsp:Transcript_2983/g.6427  ORF Transcript_2983/g.6427 Transcript_2983/m.6427 type:complete len:210 (-) Transcript_2983:55-684(-)
MPEIEEIDETADDVPDLEEIEDFPDLQVGDAPDASAAVSAATMPAPIQNRNEKKARRAMLKLGMKQVPGILRVTVKKSKNVLFAINKPDVYKSNVGADTYVIFGEAKSEDSGATARQQAAINQLNNKAAAQQDAASASAATPAMPDMEEAAAASDDAAGAEEEVVDETGLESKDIELVMSQAGCNRAKAVKALKDNDGDLVNSIMSLTK